MHVKITPMNSSSSWPWEQVPMEAMMFSGNGFCAKSAVAACCINTFLL